MTHFDNQIKQQIEALFDQLKPKDEFEFIFFGRKGRYLPLEKYIQLLKYFTKAASNNPQYKLYPPIDTLDIVFSQDQQTVLRCTLTDNNIKTYMKKVNIFKNHVIFSTLTKLSQKDPTNITLLKKEKTKENTIDIDDYDLRLRVSKELPFSDQDTRTASNLDETQMKKIIYRYKQRTSLFIEGDPTSDHFIRIDLTLTKLATTYDKLNTAIPNYELEIEYGTTKTPNRKHLSTMFTQINILLKIIQQSNFIISRSTSAAVITAYRNIFSLKTKHTTFEGRQSISLEIQHVTEKLPNKYAVTDKADGTRYFLIIVDNHIYLIDTNLDVKDIGITLPQTLSKYNGTVLDGEFIFIPSKNRHLFLIFDCLFNGQTDIRPTIKLADRHAQIDEIINDCFILGSQKGYKFNTKYTSSSNKFDLNDIIAFHYKEIKANILQLTKDMTQEPQYPLIRRKYFISSLGAKNWEIFAYAVALYAAYTDDPTIPCPYLLDGLIFQPLEQAYVSKSEESQKEDFKWKPPEKNSIDFYIEFEKDKQTNKIVKVYDNSYSDNTNVATVDETTVDIKPIRNKTYKICNLHVGNKVKDREVPVLFKEDQELHLAYLFLTKDEIIEEADAEAEAEAKTTEPTKARQKTTKPLKQKAGAPETSVAEVRDLDGDIISDKTVVEFYYNNDPTILNKFRWVPLRTRHDKTESVMRFGKRYGNYHTIAEKVWRSINNPILITDFEDLARGNIPEKNNFNYDKKMTALRKKIGYDIIASTAVENAFFQERSSLAEPMRKFHNWIKSIIIYTYCNKMYRNDIPFSVYDLGCGRGADIMKFYYVMVSFLVGTDYDREGIHSALDGCYSRYNKFRRGKPNFPRMFFAQADSTAELDYDNQLKSLKGMDEHNKQIITRFFPKDEKKRTLFDCVNCQFMIHFTFKDDISWKNFKTNVNSTLRNGGFFLVTTFDSDKVIRTLANVPSFKYEYTDKEGKVITLFEIVKKYPDTITPDTILGTGNAIDVKITWIAQDRFLTEYLVDSRFLIEELKKDCDLELVDTDSFANQYAMHEQYLTNYHKFESNPKTKKYLISVSTFYNDSVMNKGCKIWNDLQRYYVFRKKEGTPTAQKGGTDNILDFSNPDSYVIPNMEGYDPRYSFQNAIHHILRNNSVIPKTMQTQSFFEDISVPLKRDNNITYGDMENMCRKLVINHEIENAKDKVIKIEKILDGMNIFIVERDCNNQYDIDLVESGNVHSGNIILMREGDLYLPVYYIDSKSGGRQGIFRRDHYLVGEMMGQV